MATPEAHPGLNAIRPSHILRRSASLWRDSKDRCHQTTLETWHRSAGSLSEPKSRCRESAIDVLSRSVNKWNQSSERLHLVPVLCEIGIELAKGYTPPSRSCQDLHASQSPQSFPDSKAPSTSFSPHPVNIVDKQGSEEDQIREILNLTDQVVYQANQAKQLRKSQSNLLGEIELSWIDSTISEASDAARSLAKRIEPYRLDILKRKGKLKSSHRKSWRLVDSQSACERVSDLVVHQKRLENGIEHLQNVPNTSLDPLDQSEPQAPVELSSEEAAVTPTVFELSCDSATASPKSEATLVKLAGSPVLVTRSAWSIPKIIVTHAPEDRDCGHFEDLNDEFPVGQNNELDAVLQWDQTRNEIRLQQSESMSSIVAKMESARMKTDSQ